MIGMDVAASEFYNEKDHTYDLNFKEEVNSAFLGRPKLNSLECQGYFIWIIKLLLLFQIKSLMSEFL